MTTNTLPDHILELLEDGTLEDQTKVQSFQYENPAAGETGARLVEYIELGTHERKAYQGKAKAPSPKVRLTFELLAKKHLKEVEIDGVKKMIAPRISVEWDKIINDKSKFYKLLVRLQAAVPAKATKTHMAAFLNEPIKLKIVHTEVGEGADKKTYANIDFDSIGEAVRLDEEGEQVALTVPPATGQLRLFLFDKPNKATWDSLFIDGERDVKDKDGKETKVSKNFIQIKITKAINFAGSPLETLLIAGGMPDLTVEAEVPEGEDTDDHADAPEVEAPAAKAKAATKTSKKSAEAMAELGLMA